MITKPANIRHLICGIDKLLVGSLIFLALLTSACGSTNEDRIETQSSNTTQPSLTSTPLPTQVSTLSPTETPVSPVQITVIYSKVISDQDGMTLLYVPAGNFTMGSDDVNARVDEKPAHTVSLAAFQIDQTEVTNAMYIKCVAAGVCTPPSSAKSFTRGRYFGNPDFNDYPVIYVDWNMAKTYCEWVDRRLPTEAEWEKAASWDVGNQHKNVYPWGDSMVYCSLSNTADQSGFACVGDTTKVGKYPNGASPYGALDMAGNVWEWVEDWYKAYPGNRESNSGYGTIYRVLRGSAWSSGGEPAAIHRYRSSPTDTLSYAGFRCAVSATP